MNCECKEDNDIVLALKNTRRYIRTLIEKTYDIMRRQCVSSNAYIEMQGRINGYKDILSLLDEQIDQNRDREQAKRDNNEIVLFPLITMKPNSSIVITNRGELHNPISLYCAKDYDNSKIGVSYVEELIDTGKVVFPRSK